MRTKWVADRSEASAIGLFMSGHAVVLAREPLRLRRAFQLVPEFALQFGHESLDVFGRVKPSTEPHSISDRQGGAFEERPAFAQIRRVCFDDGHLYGHIRVFGNDADTGLERIDWIVSGPRPFWE